MGALSELARAVQQALQLLQRAVAILLPGEAVHVPPRDVQRALKLVQQAVILLPREAEHALSKAAWRAQQRPARG